MMTICELDAAGVWTGNVREIADTEGCPVGWVIAEPPEAQDGKVALWSGEWLLIDPPPPESAPVPAEVTPRQIRRALNAAGLRASVEAYVATLSQDEQDDWNFASTIRRDNPTLIAGARALDKTDADLDDLFRLAATFQ